MMKFKLKSYDYLMHSSYERILDGKFFDERMNPYSHEFLNKVLKYLEYNEMYEDCHLMTTIIENRFNHDKNYTKYDIR